MEVLTGYLTLYKTGVPTLVLDYAFLSHFWMVHVVYAKLSTRVASLSLKTLVKIAKIRIFKKIKSCLGTGIRFTYIR